MKTCATMLGLAILGVFASGLCEVHPAGVSALPPVTIVRVPQGGVQPDVAVDARGVLHVVYLAGDPKAADVFYTTSGDDGRTLAPPVRVNSQPGSAIALGTIRGAQLAVGREGRVHVVWNGSTAAMPPAGDGEPLGMPLLYARSADAGGFEPQRNLMTSTRHLDGGAAVAASDTGDVLVAWHANALNGGADEQSRRVWLARSRDDGRTFTPESAISSPRTGACGCCGLDIAVAGNAVDVLYRGARAQVHRDIHLLRSVDRGRTFTTRVIDAWEVGACPMSSMAVLPGAAPVYAWEHDGQVAFLSGGRLGAPAPPDHQNPRARRKHPRLARARDGSLLLAWATGTAWNTGGAVAWQVFVDGAPVGPRGSRDGLPTWSFPAVAAIGERFVLLY